MHDIQEAADAESDIDAFLAHVNGVLVEREMLAADARQPVNWRNWGHDELLTLFDGNLLHYVKCKLIQKLVFFLDCDISIHIKVIIMAYNIMLCYSKVII